MGGFENNGGLDEQSGEAWGQFAEALAEYLGTMAAQDDHLIVETPDGDSEDGVTPYAQFFVVSEGWIRAEISGNGVLAEPFRLTDDQVGVMVDVMGWQPPEEGASPNFALNESVENAGGIAVRVREVLEDFFGIPHPTLMSAHAWGPASAGVGALGIPASGDVATDIVDTEAEAEPPPFEAGVVVPRDRDHLLELVRRFLTDFLGEAPTQDDDDDFVIPHPGAPVFVRARTDQPMVDVFTRLVHDVRGRRQAAVEVTVLNGDHLMSRFILVDRAVYQVMNLPAMPFVPAHLRMALPGYLALVDEVRDDLALRTSGRSA